MREVSIASVQFRTSEDIEENLNKALRFIDEAKEKGADVVLFPEFWLTGTPTFGDNTKQLEHAESIPGPTTETLQRKAKEAGIYIIPVTLASGSPPPSMLYATIIKTPASLALFLEFMSYQCMIFT